MIEVSAVAVVDGATVVIGPPSMADRVGASGAPGRELFPAHAVEDEQHDLARIDGDPRKPARRIVGVSEQRRHDVRHAGPAVVR